MVQASAKDFEATPFGPNPPPGDPTLSTLSQDRSSRSGSKRPVDRPSSDWSTRKESTGDRSHRSPGTGYTGHRSHQSPGTGNTGHRSMVSPGSPGAPVRPVKPVKLGATTTPGLPVTPGPTGTLFTPVNTGQKALEAQDTQFLDRSELIVQNSPVRPVQLEHNVHESSDLLNSDSLDDRADESPEQVILRHSRHQSPAMGHPDTGHTGNTGTGHTGCTGHTGTSHTGSLGSTGHTGKHRSDREHSVHRTHSVRSDNENSATPQMVASGRSVSSWDPHEDRSSLPHHLYRRQPARLGSSCGTGGTSVSWTMDRRPIPAPYQCARDESNFSLSNTSGQQGKEFHCIGVKGQHYSGSLYKASGRDSFHSFLRGGVEHPELVLSSQHTAVSKEHTVKVQHSSGPNVKNG